MRIVWNNINPTCEEVLTWGYDDEILLTEQDEDLILAAKSYIAILFQLATDLQCPKNEYCDDILNNFAKNSLLSHDFEAVSEIAKVINQTASVPGQQDWVTNFQFCAALMNSCRALSPTEADDIAKYLLSASYGSDGVTRLAITSSEVAEYVKIDSYPNYLYVDLFTGKWVYHKFQRPTC